MIKNDILIQRRDALSEPINTSSEAIYFYCASIIRVEAEHVSSSGPRLLLGEALEWHVQPWCRSTAEESPDVRFVMYDRFWEQMRVIKMCFKVQLLNINLIGMCDFTIIQTKLPIIALNPLQLNRNHGKVKNDSVGAVQMPVCSVW